MSRLFLFISLSGLASLWKRTKKKKSPQIQLICGLLLILDFYMDYMNSGANTKDTMVMSLMRMLIEGPEVSL